MTYPSLLRRYASSAIDFLTLIFALYLYSRTPLYRPGGPEGALAFLLVALLYEPLLTAYACTLGQAAMRIRVRNVPDLGRISVIQAYIRLFIKYLLGTVSFLTMPARADRRAIHDLAGSTIVIEARAAKPV